MTPAPFDPLADLRGPGDPEVDVLLQGMVFLDIIFSGLGRMPASGEEIWADGMGSCPGGAANLAVATSRLGLRTSLSAAFGDDDYGDFCWRTLAEQEHIDLSTSRRFEHWHTPVTVSVAVEDDRRMITHGHDAPESATAMMGTPQRSRAVLFDLTPDAREEDTAWISVARDQGALLFEEVGFDATGVWDPASGRLLAPKPRGGGSNLAWGGIAARLGLLRPDDVAEDVLAAIPDSTMAVVRWLPAGFAAASLAAAEAIRRRRIRVPLRASLAGRIKSSASPAWGAALIAVPAAALGSVSVVPAADRMTLLTRSARIASLNAGILASALLGFTQRDGRVRPSAFLALTAASVCVEGAVLLLATKAGLRRVAASDGAASDEGASSREGGRP